MFYRKKPVTIQAWRNTEDEPDRAEAPGWLTEAIREGTIRMGGGDRGFMVIKTLEGQMRADYGDWIIRGVKGELYPCKPDVFEATYEKVGRMESLELALRASEEYTRG